MRNPIKEAIEIYDVEKDVKKDVKGSSRKIIKQKQDALKKSIKEGSAASVASSLGGSYITPFAVAINSTNFQIGLLSALSGLVAPITQLWGSKLMEHFPRKKIVLKFVFLEALMWLPLLILSLLAWKNLIPNYASYLLIVFYLLLVLFGNIAYPPWFSWMGDLVPEKDRGKYFATRTWITGIIGLVAFAIGGFILKFFQNYNLALIGFALLFLLSFIFRMISFSTFKKQYSPNLKITKEYYFSFFSFLRRYDSFGKFAVYQVVFYFAIMIASPFISVYMLKELNFSYVTYMIVSLSSSIFYLLFTPLVGKFSDKFGNTKLFYISNICFALTPIFWIFLKAPLWLILIPKLISGIANATLTIAFTNFTYNSSSPEHRSLCVTYANLLVGIGTFVGSILGGFLMKYISLSFVSTYFLVFALSALLRLTTGIFFLPKIKEKIAFKKLPRHPMHVSLVHPFKTVHAEIGWFRNVFR